MKTPVAEIKILLSLLAIFTLTTITAQPTMIVEHYTMEEGLPSDNVYNTLKDKDGFVWFGTWHGLCSFDGTRFKPYTTRPNHLSAVPPQKVRHIVEDKDGFLWIRNTDNRLYMFDKVTEAYHDISNELKRLSHNVQVIKIQLTDSGRILILTRNKDLFVAHAGVGGKVELEKIYDSKNDVDPATMRLKHNILGENGKYAYWLNTRLGMNVVTKKRDVRLLAGVERGSGITSFRYKGQYLCIGTSKGRVYVINTADGKTSRIGAGNLQEPVTSINIINGKILFTLPSGLYSATQGSSPILLTTRVPEVVRTYIDKYGKLWLCPKSGTMMCYDPATSATQTFAMPSDSLFADIKFIDTGVNGLFILQRNGEVWRYDHQTHLMQNINSMREFRAGGTTPNFFDIDIDANGIMWLSSTTDGVYKLFFPKYNFRFLFPDILDIKDTNHDTAGVRAVYQSRNGDLWVGTRDGNLYCIDIKTHKVRLKFDKSDIGTVYHIMEDKSGNLWFSTKGAGLVKATHDALAPDGIRLTRYTSRRGDRNSINSNRVYYTYQDSHGRIWVCTFYGGLNLIEQKGGRLVFRNRQNGLSTYPRYELYTDVRSITEDSHGRLWVGTTDGLMSFDGNFRSLADIKFETYRGQNSSGVTSNDISSMFKDSHGRIWLGIFGNGLNLLERYDSKSHLPVLKHFTVNGQGGGDVVTSITEDKNNCLWISTENGIASLREGSSYVKGYDRYAGFPDVTLEDNTSLCLQSGDVLVGCRQGLLCFSPETVMNDNETRFKTFVVGFKVMNRDLDDFDPPILRGSVKYARKIVLKHNQSTFTIEFTSPRYAGSKIPYTYILDGYEDQWHANGNNRIASYANVPPGHYTFRVKVDDNSSPETTLEVVVLPPWWATWWARTIYVLLALAALYAILRTVMYVIRMRNEVYINDRLAELKIRFFTNVSHELRTPLSLIKGPVDELKANEKLSPAGREYLDLIERNSTKMLQLVNQILDFRKIQNGKMKMHVSLVSLNAMIESLVGEFKVLADERHITLNVVKPEDAVMAWCDAGKIGVVLNNLLNNAFKYTADGGKISITLGSEGETCTIRVEDDGVGIPKSQLELIFERFSQADNKTSPGSPSAGTGIGLSLAREYVNMHDGHIWAENLTDDAGVAFTVQLPTGRDHFNAEQTEVYFDDSTAHSPLVPKVTGTDAGKDNNGNESGTANAASTDGTPTVMLIEDNADMCRMLQLQLGSRYNVLTAHDGEEGLEMIYRHHPDIIITDLMMPGTGGLDLLRSVRHDFNISHIPVVILTAKNTEEDRMSAVKAGANAFIAKPFSSSYLMARLEQLLNEQRIFQRKIVVQTTVGAAPADNKADDYGSHLVKKDIEFVHKIQDIIELNLNSADFNIDTIAETIGLSRSAFFKKLKSLTGLAPVDLVKEVRLNKAAQIIEKTDNSITQTAYEVGFSDPGYFGKCFRRKFGMTPKEYRKAARAGKISTQNNSNGHGATDNAAQEKEDGK